MKDQVFSGADVTTAVASASRTLGIPAAQLRYVVLEQGTAEGKGVKASAARIAVMLEPQRAGAPAGAVVSPAPARSVAKTMTEADLPETLRAVVREFGRAADIELQADVTREPDGLLVRIGGADAAGLTPEEVGALVHVLQKAGTRGTLRVPVAVEAAGARVGRDEELKAIARALAQAVRATGDEKETQPLNGYERRVVHVALAEDPVVETYSVGEGDTRRVKVVRRVTSGSSELM